MRVEQFDRWSFFFIRMFLWGFIAGNIWGCAAAPPPPPAVLPTMPAPTDVERLIPPAPAPAPIPADLPRFADRSVGPQECPGLPEGILTSERAYRERISLIAAGRRCAAEAQALTQLRVEERAAAVDLEAAYRARVSELERQLGDQRRWAPWRFWGGIAAGAAGMLLASWAAGQVSR